MREVLMCWKPWSFSISEKYSERWTCYILAIINIYTILIIPWLTGIDTCIHLGQHSYIRWTSSLDCCLVRCTMPFIYSTLHYIFYILYSVCISLWWWVIYIHVYYVNSYSFFADYSIKSFSQKKIIHQYICSLVMKLSTCASISSWY